VPLDRDLAVDADPVAGAFDRVRLEGKLRVALGVEELGRLEMASRFGSLTWTEATLADPVSTPSATTASKSPKPPVNVPAR
jgi:hypothetical protein